MFPSSAESCPCRSSTAGNPPLTEYPSFHVTVAGRYSEHWAYESELAVRMAGEDPTPSLIQHDTEGSKGYATHGQRLGASPDAFSV